MGTLLPPGVSKRPIGQTCQECAGICIAGGSKIEGDIPFKVVWFSLSGNKVSSSPHLAFEVDWGYSAAELLYDEKDIIRKSNFHLVWWDGLGATMSRYPKMYHVLVGNSNFQFQFLGPPSEVEFWFRFQFQRFRLEFFLNSAVEKLRNWNSDSEIWNSEKNKRRNWIHLILHKRSIVIGQLVDLTMLNVWT
jgi:hypothetical protein